MKNIGVRITRHDENNYSLMMSADDVTVDLFSHNYDHRIGNHSTLTFQGVTVEEMLELSEKIREVAKKEEAKNEKH